MWWAYTRVAYIRGGAYSRRFTVYNRYCHVCSRLSVNIKIFIYQVWHFTPLIIFDGYCNFHLQYPSDIIYFSETPQKSWYILHIPCYHYYIAHTVYDTVLFIFEYTVATQGSYHHYYTLLYLNYIYLLYIQMYIILYI
jgi:hypothetical protein